MSVNNFLSSVDGQLELLAQATLDSAVCSVGALHALRPRLSHFHQLLLEPPEVGQVGEGGGGGGQPCPQGGAGVGTDPLYACSWSRCARHGAAWPRHWATLGCMWSSCWPVP